jgi:hypothetical protein
MRRSLLVAIPVIAVAGVLALPALAAPDRSVKLNATTTTFEWDGGPVTGTPVNDVDTDDTLVTLETPGALKIETTDPDDGAQDIDIWLYKADAAGDPAGEHFKDAETDGSEETLTADLAEGRYVVRVLGFIAVNGHFKGHLTFTPNTGGSPTPGGPADTPPEAVIAKMAKAAKASRLKKFKGTAHDDVSVARVDIALVKVKGGKCTQMTSPGKYAPLAKCDAPTKFHKAKGTTSWSYKLSKALQKGSYVLYARATDGAGQVQGGFGASNRRAFKVK